MKATFDDASVVDGELVQRERFAVHAKSQLRLCVAAGPSNECDLLLLVLRDEVTDHTLEPGLVVDHDVRQACDRYADADHGKPFVTTQQLPEMLGSHPRQERAGHRNDSVDVARADQVVENFVAVTGIVSMGGGPTQVTTLAWRSRKPSRIPASTGVEYPSPSHETNTPMVSRFPLPERRDPTGFSVSR